MKHLTIAMMLTGTCLLPVLTAPDAGARASGHPTGRHEGVRPPTIAEDDLPRPVWKQLPSMPVSLRRFSAVYDSHRGRLVVYDGPSRDVWVYSDSDRPSWSLLATAGTLPPWRLGHVAMYDPVRDRMLVFGGLGYTDDVPDPLNDLWALSFSEPTTWTQPLPTWMRRPDGRRNSSIIYDSVRDRMIVHGGLWDSQLGQRIDVGGTWELTLSDDMLWSRLSTAGSLPRAHHAAVFDAAGDRMLIFGGKCALVCGSSASVFALSLEGHSVWSNPVIEEAPVARRSSLSAVYDPAADGVVVFGGQFGGAEFDELWLLSLSEEEHWDLLERTSPWPLPRSGHTLAYDTQRQRILMVGPSQELWALEWEGAGAGQPLPLQVLVVDPQATTEQVRVRWYTGNMIGGSTVYRREENLDWQPIGTLDSGATGHISFLDRSVEPGARYAYRLGVMREGQETYVGEVWVDVPLPLPVLDVSLAIESAQWRSAGGSAGVVEVHMTLQNSLPARLELLDVSGRRVASQSFSAAAGAHSLAFEAPVGLPAGSYVLRLRQGGAAAAVKLVVVR